MIGPVLVGAVVQVAAVLIIALFVWMVRGRKKAGFFDWIGLKPPKIADTPLFWKLYVVALLGTIGLGYAVLLFTGRSELANSQFHGLGVSGLAAVGVYAFVQTALSEELLFRGLIGKRAIAAFGFPVGNLVQSALFGLLHGVLLYGTAGILRAAVVVLFTGTLGWIMGYINERLADGSIIPSWTIHALGNLVSSVLMLFSLLK